MYLIRLQVELQINRVTIAINAIDLFSRLTLLFVLIAIKKSYDVLCRGGRQSSQMLKVDHPLFDWLINWAILNHF